MLRIRSSLFKSNSTIIYRLRRFDQLIILHPYYFINRNNLIVFSIYRRLIEIFISPLILFTAELHSGTYVLKKRGTLIQTSNCMFGVHCCPFFRDADWFSRLRAARFAPRAAPVATVARLDSLNFGNSVIRPLKSLTSSSRTGGANSRNYDV